MCVCVCVCEADCCDSLLPVVLDVLQSGINASHSLFNIVRGEELWGEGDCQLCTENETAKPSSTCYRLTLRRGVSLNALMNTSLSTPPTEPELRPPPPARALWGREERVGADLADPKVRVLALLPHELTLSRSSSVPPPSR